MSDKGIFCPRTLLKTNIKRVLDKRFDILELLSTQPKGMTRAEILKAMGRNPSEIYRMIERLVIREYLFRSIKGDRYTLSMKLYLLDSHNINYWNDGAVLSYQRCNN